MRFLLFTISLVALAHISLSQDKIGYYFDLNGQLINGYYDPVDYTPKRGLSITFEATGKYEKGKIYDQTGKSKNGFIKFKNSKILFKPGLDAKKIALEPKEVPSFVVGIDSFMVAENFRPKPVYVQFLGKYDTYVFARYHNLGMSGVSTTIIVTGNDSEKWTELSHLWKNQFAKEAGKYFEHLPYLKTSIDEKKLGVDDLHSMVKYAEYEYKFRHNIPIYFNRHLVETRHSNSEIVARITDKKDSIFYINFYRKGILRYSGQYYLFNPFKKHGPHTIYYPDGKVWKKTIFEKNEVKESFTYRDSGELHLHEKFEDDEREFLVVNDRDGHNIIEMSGEERIMDDLTGREIINRYKDKKLVSSYRISDGEKIFQPFDPEEPIKWKYFRYKLSEYYSMNKKDLIYEVDDNAQGTILISMIADEKGTILEYRILNQLHPVVDKFLQNFMENAFEKGEINSGIKPCQVDKEKVKVEFIVPFTFTINRFYDYSYQYNDWWLQHQMMQQQMMNQSPNINPPPRPPSGF